MHAITFYPAEQNGHKQYINRNYIFVCEADANLFRGIRVGASIQEQLNDLQMTLLSGDDERSGSIL